MADTAGLLLDNGVTRVHIVTFAGHRLDVAGASIDDDAAVIQWTPTDGKNQEWVIDPAGTPDHPDEVRLIAAHSGRCLGVASPADGFGAIVFAWEGQATQFWRRVTNPDGSVGLVNDRIGRRLDVGGADPNPGARICAWTDNGQPNQRFRLEAV